jgi:hypothetical protein
MTVLGLQEWTMMKTLMKILTMKKPDDSNDDDDYIPGLVQCPDSESERDSDDDSDDDDDEDDKDEMDPNEIAELADPIAL